MAEEGLSPIVASVTEMPTSNFSLHTPGSRYQYEDESVEICNVLNRLGYGPDIIQARRQAYMKSDMLMSTRSRNMAVWISTGSMAEGLTYFLAGKRDIIVVINEIVCLEDGVAASTVPSDTAVLILDIRMSSPGYCRLLFEKHGLKMPTVLYNALCDDGSGRALLSSDLFLNGYASYDIEHQTNIRRAGPSMPYTVRGSLDMDHVVALRCYCPSILQRWAERPRHWPPPDIVQKVMSLGAFVTPVGFKGSEYQHVEWRICFSTGETELVGNLNKTQIQVYIMLKMIMRDILKPRKKGITSFVLKSIVLWLAENNSQALFNERKLCHWLLEGLGALRTALVTNQLSYYMIPERNLMAACGIENEQQRSWIATITDMMNEGLGVVLRLETLRKAIISHPEPLMWYSKMRTELELLMLKYMNRRLMCSDEEGVTDETDLVMQAISQRQSEIVREVVMRMHLEGSIVYDLHDVLFRMLTGSDLT